MYIHLEYIIGTYISFRQETVIMKVVMWPLLNLVFGLNYKMFKPTWVVGLNPRYSFSKFII
jgi:hypothetical protein